VALVSKIGVTKFLIFLYCWIGINPTTIEGRVGRPSCREPEPAGQRIYSVSRHWKVRDLSPGNFLAAPSLSGMSAHLGLALGTSALNLRIYRSRSAPWCSAENRTAAEGLAKPL